MAAAPPHHLPVAQREISIPLPEKQPIAATRGLVWKPTQEVASTATVVLGHGAGSTMTNPILEAVGTALAAAGHVVLAFNFAYTELGRRSPDPMPRLQSTYAAAIEAARHLAADRPLILGGRSMGGRVGTMLAAEGQACDGLLLLGYPLHPVGRPDKLRVAHWPSLDVPMLFLTGTRDAMFTLDLFREHRAALRGEVTLHLLEGADHGFAARRADGRTKADVLREVCDASVAWVGRQVER